MACLPNTPCGQKKPCSDCQPAVPSGAACQVDSKTIIYHLTPGQVSKLSCLKIGNGANLEQILEKIDTALCSRGVEVGSLSLGCLASSSSPTDLTGVLNLLIAQLCQLKNDTSISTLISQLLNNSGFISGLVTRLLANSAFLTGLATNATFINALLGNTSFLTGLAGNSTFVTALANNPSFISQVGTKLIQSDSFVTGLVNRIVNDSVLKQLFCCSTTPTNPCTSLTVNGVQSAQCTCTPASNLQVTGAATTPTGTQVTYTAGYGGSAGSLAWTVTGGTKVSQTATQVVVNFTAGGSQTVTATLTGCDGATLTASRAVTVTSPCTAPSGLSHQEQTGSSYGTVNAAPVKNATHTYRVNVGAGTTPYTYQWSVDNGSFDGGSTGQSVSITWDQAVGTGYIRSTVSNACGTSQQFSTVLQVQAPSTGPEDLTAAPTGQPGQFTVSFDDSSSSGPYTYAVTDPDSGNIVAQGDLPADS